MASINPKTKNPKDEIAIRNLGHNVRKQRNLKQITMVDLAGMCNVDYTTISKIERGKINTTVSMISLIAKALNIPIATLFEELKNSNDPQDGLDNPDEL